MRRMGVRGAVLALALLAAPMLGCEAKTIKVQLPGFNNGTVDGIWLWKQIDGQWRRVCRIDFTDRRMTHRGETLYYVQNCIDGEEKRGLVLPAAVERMPGNPGTITVDLWYLRYEDGGTYRASAFNESGESTLSSTSVVL